MSCIIRERKLVQDLGTAVLLTAAVGLLGSTYPCQGAENCFSWHEVPSLARSGHAMAFDSHRRVFVVFGGERVFQTSYLPWRERLGDTWELPEGESNWRRRSTTGPAPGSGYAMVYDSARRVCVLYGAPENSDSPAETWEWDGGMWERVATTGPAARNGHAMVYDSRRRRTTLFGGLITPTQASGETWQWNGFAWSRLEVAGPDARYDHAMVYSPDREAALLFGGKSAAGQAKGDTWLWNGSEWSFQADPGPSPRFGHGLAIEGLSWEGFHQEVLFGGRSPGTDGRTYSFKDVWAWTSEFGWWPFWVDEYAPCPAARHDHIMGSEASQVVLFGGRDATTNVNYSDTWRRPFGEFSAWYRSSAGEPAPCHGAAMAYDPLRHEAVVFGGVTDCNGRVSGQTWVRTAEGNWQLRATEGPAAGSGYSMAYHPVSRSMILAGGGTKKSWGSWNGHSEWSSCPDLPNSMRDVPLAYDSARQEILFRHKGTWTWKSGLTAWTNRAGAGPSERTGHGMAFDENRGVMVLFGGQPTAGGYLGDTWEWNGTSWTERAVTGPAACAFAAMTYDPDRRLVLLDGGAGSSGGVANGLWSWDGTEWRPEGGGAGLIQNALCYDSNRQRLLSFGGTPVLWECAPASSGLMERGPDADCDRALDGEDNCPGLSNPTQADTDSDGVGDACDACLTTVFGVPVNAAGCSEPVPGDYDGDGDVDLVDFQSFAACLTGPGVLYSETLPPGCTLPVDPQGVTPADFDRDMDVDADDFAAFQRCHSGRRHAANPDCAS